MLLNRIGYWSTWSKHDFLLSQEMYYSHFQTLFSLSCLELSRAFFNLWGLRHMCKFPVISLLGSSLTPLETLTPQPEPQKNYISCSINSCKQFSSCLKPKTWQQSHNNSLPSYLINFPFTVSPFEEAPAPFTHCPVPSRVSLQLAGIFRAGGQWGKTFRYYDVGDVDDHLGNRTHHQCLKRWLFHHRGSQVGRRQ